MKDLNPDKKIDILISALEERYSSMHKIRDRVQSIGIWVLGGLIAASAWIFQNEIVFRPNQKFIYIIAILVALYVLRFIYLEDLSKGFKGQQQIAVKLEKSLGFFTPNFFDDASENSMYPEKWQKAGTPDGDGKFFNSSYILIYTGVVFLILSILLSGCGQNDDILFRMGHRLYFPY